MTTQKNDESGDALSCSVLPGFKPLRVLWEGPEAQLPSETMTRWQLRRLKPKLVAAGALARWERGLWVRPDVFVRVLRKDAIERVAVRAQEAGA